MILTLILTSEEDDEETAEERDARLLDSLKCTSHGHVTLNEEGQLVWPVRLLYPEHATSDVIQQFSEVRVVTCFHVLYGYYRVSLCLMSTFTWVITNLGNLDILER